MKALYLLRHAKSSWDDDQLSDEDRPLTKRGRRDCELVVAELERDAHIPDYIYCSTARRAQETLKRFRQSSPSFAKITTFDDEGLYTFDMQNLLARLKELPNDHASVMVVGHNPALLDLANYLYDGEIKNLGTCTLIEFEVNVEYWDQLRCDCSKLVNIVRPKQLR